MSDKEPTEKLRPLAVVCFAQPTYIPGITTALTTIEMGVRRLVDGKEWYPESMWLDPNLRLIKINGRSYPLERVHYFEQAKTAFAKVPPPLKIDPNSYQIGKRFLKQ